MLITKNNILVFDKDFVQGIKDTTIYAELILLKKTTTKNCLSVHYNGANSYLFVNDTEIHKFKAKDTEIETSSLCLANISKDLSVDNIKKKPKKQN